VAGAILSSAIGFPVAGFIGGVAGWRSYLSWYVLPISVAALALAYFSIPKETSKPRNAIGKSTYLSSFKQVLLNKSALACAIGNMFLHAAGVWSFFAAAFWIKTFQLTIQNVGILTLVMTLSYAMGSLIGGQLMNRVGRKRMVVPTFLLRGVLIGLIVFMPSFWAALAMSFAATFVGGLAVASGPSLSLEQVPLSRGTMMSISGVFGSLGVTFGASVGALALGQFGYQMMGITFGLFGVVAALVIFFAAKDPCKY